MNLDAPTLEALTTVVGASILVIPLTEALKRAWNPPPEIQDRFMPLVSMGVGILVVLVAMFGLGLTASVNLVQGVVNGIFAGLAACGMYDTYRGFSKS